MNQTITRLKGSEPDFVFLAIAEIHVAQIRHGVLSRLGPKLLGRIYREISQKEGSGVWVAMDGHEVVGFIAGCINTRSTFSKVLPGILFPVVLNLPFHLFRMFAVKFFRILLYPFRNQPAVIHSFSHCHTAKPELLSIAISESQQKTGLGRRLVETFEQGLRDWCCTGKYRVASDISVPESNRFYLRNGFLPCHIIRLNDMELQVYLKGIPASDTTERK
jgi:GNAT superfamily N-acetyltransferase